MQPENQLRAYLRSLPKDIVTARKTLDELKANKLVPDATKKTLQDAFEVHIATLTSNRAQLEEMESSGDHTDMDLRQIKCNVIKMQQGVK